MINNIPKKFTLLFVLLIVLELISNQLYNSLHYITKPLIVSSLILYFFSQSNKLNYNTKFITVTALLFSVIGDILLMFVEKNSLYFMLGLVSFLIAHIMYILVFKKLFQFNKSVLFFAIILLIYAYYLFTLLQPKLGDMLVPVVLYMAVILCMALFAYGRKISQKLSYILVLIGAILFLLSDSILALNKFYKPILYPDISIMFTYAFAQYFIVLGILKQSH